MTLTTDLVTIKNPDEFNLVLGQSHFIKTVEDIEKLMAKIVPDANYGLAFCEASGGRLIRTAGNDPDLINLATENAQLIGAGHSFIIFVKNAFPINFLSQLKQVPEIVTIFAATANPLQVVVAQSEQGRGVIGVIDGGSPQGVENDQDKKDRHQLLRKLGY